MRRQHRRRAAGSRAAHQRLAAGQAHVARRPSPTKQPHQPLDLLEAEDLGALEPRQAVGGHAVLAAEVAAVGDGDAQIARSGGRDRRKAARAAYREGTRDANIATIHAKPGKGDPMRVSVVGGGLMGSGIAEVCARSGVDVTVVEVDDGAPSGRAPRSTTLAGPRVDALGQAVRGRPRRGAVDRLAYTTRRSRTSRAPTPRSRRSSRTSRSSATCSGELDELLPDAQLPRVATPPRCRS